MLRKTYVWMLTVAYCISLVGCARDATTPTTSSAPVTESAPGGAFYDRFGLSASDRDNVAEGSSA